MTRPVVEVFIPFVRIARMDPIRPTCNTKRVGGIRDAADISGIPGDFDAPGAVGNTDTSGTGNPSTSGTGNPDTFDIPNIIGASGALGIDPRPADPSPGAADQDWSIWMSLGQAC